MASLRSGVSFAFAVALGGCASTYPTKELPPPPDFSVTVPGDMGTGGTGGNGGDGADLAAGGDSGGRDLGAAAADLASPADLARCVLAADDDGGVAPALYVVAPAAGTMFAARRAGGAWMELPATGAAVDDVALASVAGRTFVAARLHDGTLAAGALDPCRGTFVPMSAIAAGASTSLRPALVGGNGGDVVFRGAVNNDQRYYWAHFDGAGWGAIATQGNFLSTLPPTALRTGGAVHTIFTGTDGNLYDGTVQASGGGTATKLTGNTSALAPAAALAPDGTVHVVYTGTNRHLYWFAAATPGTVHDLCDGQAAGCFIVSNYSPALTVGSDGAPVVVFRGDDGKLYASRLGGTQWSAAVAISGVETTSVAPALSGGGADGSLADVVYVRDGDQLLRHVRLDAGGWQPADTIAAVAVSGAPALAVAP